jgi:hypothetical protein
VLIREEGISHMIIGSAILANHVVATRETGMKGSSLEVVGHSSFPPVRMCWLNRFRVLSPKACGIKMIL